MHRFRTPELFLGCFLTIAVFAAGMFFAGYPSQREQSSQQRAADQTPATEGVKHGFWEKAADDPVAYFTLWLVGFTGVLAVSTIGLWAVTWRSGVRQSREMQASIAASQAAVEVAKQSLEVIERAFVFVGKFNFDVVTEADEPGWWVSVEWKNSGNTPARAFVNRINIKTFIGEPDRDYTFPDQAVGQEAPSGIIGPGGVEHSAIAKIPFSVVMGVQAQQRRLFIWGWAEYDDIFGTPHRTEYCDELTIDSKGMPVRRMYGRHNGADSECERQPRPASERRKPLA